MAASLSSAAESLLQPIPRIRRRIQPNNAGANDTPTFLGEASDPSLTSNGRDRVLKRIFRSHADRNIDLGPGTPYKEKPGSVSEASLVLLLERQQRLEKRRRQHDLEEILFEINRQAVSAECIAKLRPIPIPNDDDGRATHRRKHLPSAAMLRREAAHRVLDRWNEPDWGCEDVDFNNTMQPGSANSTIPPRTSGTIATTATSFTSDHDYDDFDDADVEWQACKTASSGMLFDSHAKASPFPITEWRSLNNPKAAVPLAGVADADVDAAELHQNLESGWNASVLPPKPIPSIYQKRMKPLRTLLPQPDESVPLPHVQEVMNTIMTQGVAAAEPRTATSQTVCALVTYGEPLQRSERLSIVAPVLSRVVADPPQRKSYRAILEEKVASGEIDLEDPEVRQVIENVLCPNEKVGQSMRRVEKKRSKPRVSKRNHSVDTRSASAPLYHENNNLGADVRPTSAESDTYHVGLSIISDVAEASDVTAWADVEHSRALVATVDTIEAKPTSKAADRDVTMKKRSTVVPRNEGKESRDIARVQKRNPKPSTTKPVVVATNKKDPTTANTISIATSEVSAAPLPDVANHLRIETISDLPVDASATPDAAKEIPFAPLPTVVATQLTAEILNSTANESNCDKPLSAVTHETADDQVPLCLTISQPATAQTELIMAEATAETPTECPLPTGRESPTHSEIHDKESESEYSANFGSPVVATASEGVNDTDTAQPEVSATTTLDQPAEAYEGYADEQFEESPVRDPQPVVAVPEESPEEEPITLIPERVDDRVAGDQDTDAYNDDGFESPDEKHNAAMFDDIHGANPANHVGVDNYSSDSECEAPDAPGPACVPADVAPPMVTTDGQNAASVDEYEADFDSEGDAYANALSAALRKAMKGRTSPRSIQPAVVLPPPELLDAVSGNTSRSVSADPQARPDSKHRRYSRASSTDVRPQYTAKDFFGQADPSVSHAPEKSTDLQTADDTDEEPAQYFNGGRPTSRASTDNRGRTPVMTPTSDVDRWSRGTPPPADEDDDAAPRGRATSSHRRSRKERKEAQPVTVIGGFEEIDVGMPVKEKKKSRKEKEKSKLPHSSLPNDGMSQTSSTANGRSARRSNNGMALDL